VSVPLRCSSFPRRRRRADRNGRRGGGGGGTRADRKCAQPSERAIPIPNNSLSVTICGDEWREAGEERAVGGWIILYLYFFVFCFGLQRYGHRHHWVYVLYVFFVYKMMIIL